MTRADFYDWLVVHGCKVEPLNSHRQANSIKVSNKHGHVYLDLPIDGKEVKEYYVCKACLLWLQIPVPDVCKSSEDLAVKIQQAHYPDKK